MTILRNTDEGKEWRLQRKDQLTTIKNLKKIIGSTMLELKRMEKKISDMLIESVNLRKNLVP